MRRRGSTAALLATAAIAGGAAVGGCGSGDEDATATAATQAASTGAVEIADFAYGPQRITVDAGTEVTWTNSDDAAHTATADDGSFDTGDLDKGDARNVTFEKAGSFTYYCRFHPFMKATVEVR
jgi:plastocyanin